MHGPYCPMCQSDDLRLEEGDNDLSSWITQQVSCRRCETEFTARYQFTSIDEITVTQPYGPPYVTRDAECALLAWGEDEGDWTSVRGNGALFVVGYEPWLPLQGYTRKAGWTRIDEQEFSALLAGGA